MGVRQTNVPTEMAYTFTNNTPPATHRERGIDRLAPVSVKSTLPVGQMLGKYMMSPLYHPGTRLSQIAQSYQLFRFRSARLHFIASLPTATSGAIVMAYSQNPEFDLGSSPNNSLFAMRGVSTSVFTRASVPMSVGDRNKWYILDADSRELQDTIQGFFAIALDQVVSLTAETMITVCLEYDVEFKDAAVQQFKTSTIVVSVSSGTWTSGSPWNTTCTFSPALSAGTSYLIVPAYTIASGEDQVTATVVTYSGTSYTFYESIDALDEGDQILNSRAPFTSTAASWYAILPN